MVRDLARTGAHLPEHAEEQTAAALDRGAIISLGRPVGIVVEMPMDQRYDNNIPCPACAGVGYARSSGPCPVCHGSGLDLSLGRAYGQKCLFCGGAGTS